MRLRIEQTTYNALVGVERTLYGVLALLVLPWLYHAVASAVRFYLSYWTWVQK